MLQMDNASYHWTTKAPEFYSNNGIKVINWIPYLSDFNQIVNIWASMREKNN